MKAFKEKIENFLVQPEFSIAMKEKGLDKELSIAIGTSQFSEFLAYGCGHCLFVANGYPPRDFHFPRRFPEGRCCESNFRMTKVNAYLLKKEEPLIVPCFLWDDVDALKKNVVGVEIAKHYPYFREFHPYRVILNSDEKIVGWGSWNQGELVIVNADNAVLHILKKDEICRIDEILEGSIACSDFSCYILNEQEFSRYENIPSQGGVGIFIS